MLCTAALRPHVSCVMCHQVQPATAVDQQTQLTSPYACHVPRAIMHMRLRSAKLCHNVRECLNYLLAAAEMLPVGHKRKRVQTKLFGDDFVREDLRPGKAARRRKVMEPGGPDEAQGADALLSLAALAEEAEEAESDTQSADEGSHNCSSLL